MREACGCSQAYKVTNELFLKSFTLRFEVDTRWCLLSKFLGLEIKRNPQSVNIQLADLNHLVKSKFTQNYYCNHCHERMRKMWRNNLLAADATWCPGSVFGLAVRLLGLYFMWHGTEGFVDLVTGFPPITVPSLRGMTVPPTNPRFITVLLISIGYLISGLYLIRKPHDLVSLAFPKD